MERFEIFTICRRPPVLQTDASVGMMKRKQKTYSAVEILSSNHKVPLVTMSH